MDLDFSFFQPATITVTAITAVLWFSKVVTLIQKHRDEPGASTVSAIMELLQSILTSGAIVAASTVTENAIRNESSIKNVFRSIETSFESDATLREDNDELITIVTAMRDAFSESDATFRAESEELLSLLTSLRNTSSELDTTLRAEVEELMAIITALRDASSESSTVLRSELTAQMDALLNVHKITEDKTERVLQTAADINYDQVTIAADIAQNASSLAEILRQIELLKSPTVVAQFSLLLRNMSLPPMFQMSGMTFVAHEGTGYIGPIGDRYGYVFLDEGLTIIMPAMGVKHVALTVCIGASSVTGEALDESGSTLAVYDTPSEGGCHTIQFEGPSISAVRLIGGDNEAMIAQVLAGGAPE